MRKLGVLTVLLTIAAPFSAWSQTYSQEDEAACTPDVMRLCQQYIPNRQNIIACMVENKRNLGPECAAVFARPPSAQRATDDDRRRQRRAPSTHLPN